MVAQHQFDKLTIDDVYFNTEFRSILHVYGYNSLQLIALTNDCTQVKSVNLATDFKHLLLYGTVHVVTR